MQPVLAVLPIVLLLALWAVFMYRDRRAWSPLWMAFSATLAAAIFLVAGTLGYTLRRHERFVDGTAWAQGVIWWEIWVGVAAAAMALYFWRRGLRTLRT